MTFLQTFLRVYQLTAACQCREERPGRDRYEGASIKPAYGHPATTQVTSDALPSPRLHGPDVMVPTRSLIAHSVLVFVHGRACPWRRLVVKPNLGTSAVSSQLASSGTC
jgi:hypothetical protein